MISFLLLSFIGLCFSRSGQNPFVGQKFYVNPAFQSELQSSIKTASGKTKQNLLAIYNQSSAFWIDTMSKISDAPVSLKVILQDSSTYNPPHLIVVIVYDLPNRDCHAHASNGEICCTTNHDGTCDYMTSGNCSAGLLKYKSLYIDKIRALLAQYPTVPVVAVIEPDSLPNLATNQGDPRCGNTATVTAYQSGITYAIQQLSQLPQVTLYLDAAHGGWLGWDSGLDAYVSVVNSLQVYSMIRGFSTNVANYQPLGVQCPAVAWCQNQTRRNDPCCTDPCNLESQWNFANNEYNYAMLLQASFNNVAPGFEPRFITDTGRNGVPNMRQSCSDWCNIRGAGIGRFSTANTTNTSLFDAYFWLKTPGESDGCTQTLPNGQQCARFDSACSSPDSIGSQSGEPRAPVAGNWFDYQIKQLALNMNES